MIHPLLCLLFPTSKHRAKPRKIRREMERKASFELIAFIIFSTFCFSAKVIDSQTDSCGSSLNLQNVNLPFDPASLHCLAVWDAHNYILRYSQTSSNIWTFVLSAPVVNTYIAIGFSSKGRMVGSSAIVGWMSSTDGTGMMKQYLLGGTTPDLVEPNKGNLVVSSNFSLITTQSNRTYLGFQLETSQPLSNIIYSIGPSGFQPASPDYRLREHDDKVATFINFITGTSSTSNVSPYSKLRRSHGVLNMLGWGILMIIGVIVARYLKPYDPLWFYLHTGIQSFGFVLGIIGVVCGFILNNKLNADVSSHKSLGIFILVLGCLQVIAILVRPDKEAKLRKYWNWYHQGVGRSLIILAIANVFYGIHLGEKGTSWNAGYGAVLAILFVIAVILEIRLWSRK